MLLVWDANPAGKIKIVITTRKALICLILAKF